MEKQSDLEQARKAFQLANGKVLDIFADARKLIANRPSLG